MLFKSLIVGLILFVISDLVLSGINSFHPFNAEEVELIIPVDNDNAFRVFLMFAFAGVFALAINQFYDEEISYGKYIEKKAPP